MFYPVMVNGQNYVWGNIVLSMFGSLIIQVKKITFNEMCDSVNNYGAGNQPVSYGSGNVRYDANIELFYDQWLSILKAAPGNKFYNIGNFTTTINLDGVGVPFTSSALNNCRFLKNPFESKQGDTEIGVNVPMIYAGLVQTIL